MVVEKEGEEGRYVVRHPLIAEYVIEQAPPDSLAEAYLSFLRMISMDVPVGRERKLSRGFRVYRDTLSHRRLHGIFKTRPELVRHIYDGIKQYCRDDGYYWLHYGLYELEYGDEIDAAENYLKQAQALLPDSWQVETAYAHLLMKKACASSAAGPAELFMEEGRKILREQMTLNKDVKGHPFHIYGSQMITYIRKWLPEEERGAAFNDLYSELDKRLPIHLRNVREFKQLLDDLKRFYLSSAVAQKSS